MPWVEEKPGSAVVEDISGINQPGTVANNLLDEAGALLGRGGAMTGGAEVGGAIGALAPPPIDAVTVPVGAAIGAGVANIGAAKALPKELGGDADESALSAFLWGAVPEGTARGVSQALARHALKRGATAAHEAIMAGLEEPASAAEQMRGVADVMNRQTLRPPPVMTGEALTDATNQVRGNVLNSINQQRRELGEPIGEAYKALKGDDRVSEKEAADIADAARQVKDNLIAPSPKAQGIFARIKQFRPPMGPEEVPTEAKLLRNEQTGEVMVRGHLTASDVNWMKLNNFSDDQIAHLLEASKPYQPPSLDELRELRQRTNIALRKATGGDVHALLNLQQAIDEHLMPHLPPEINRQRELYRGFMTRFPWRDVNKVNEMGTPTQVADYVFGGTPERTAEILGHVSPQDRPVLQNAFTDKVLSNLDPNLPPEDQVKQVQKQIAPYIANGSVDQIWGSQSTDGLQRILYAPLHMQRLAKLMEQPEQAKQFAEGFIEVAKDTPFAKREAAERGMEKLIASLPPAERARFIKPAMPGVAMPVLPTTGEAVTAGALPAGSSKIVGYAGRRATYTVPMVAARMGMGGGAGVAYGAANAAALATIVLGSKGYRAVMENGGANAYARLLASKGGKQAARATMEMLVGIGSAAGEQAANSED